MGAEPPHPEPDARPERWHETAAEVDARDERPPDDALVELLFHEALALPESERVAWLGRRCGGDARLAREVASLLAAAGGAPSFLEAPPDEAAELLRRARLEGTRRDGADGDGPDGRRFGRDIDRAAAESLVGREVGEFTLQAVIGQGGMGVVYRAEQRQPQRTVALKLVRPGSAGESLLRRLEFEAEILGRLRHPGIASVYAAGSADLGFGPQPFVAMEFVEGWPLREWDRASRPDVATKVRVLIAIAEAVQHAHQNGIIHRDLKPENLLVEESASGAPRPRVLDFGVARLASSFETERSRAIRGATQEGHLVGTLQYMSPEQVRGDPVDTRCDVFALGLIAWELFAGRPARTLGEGSLAGAVKAVLEERPRPLHAVDPTVALDLSLIVGKALEAEPERRYASAHDFAADLERFLRSEPVTARAPTLAYLALRYARRHRARVGAAMTVAAIAIAAFVAVTALLVRTRAAEERERQRADDSTAVVDYMLWTLGIDPQVQATAPVDVARLRELLGSLERDVDARLGHRPQAQARLLNAIGEKYHTLNDYAKAREIFARSLELARPGEIRGDSRTDVLHATALHGLAAAEFFLAQGDATALTAVRGRYEAALAARIGALGREHSDTALTMRHLAAVLRTTGDLAGAERLYRESLAIHERLHAAGDPIASATMVASGYNGLATFLGGRGEHREAEELFARSLTLLRSMPDADRRAVDEARVLRNLGVEQGANGSVDAALLSLADAESIFRQQLGATNREVAATLLRRAQVESRAGRVEASKASARAILDGFALPEGDSLRAEASRLAGP